MIRNLFKAVAPMLVIGMMAISNPAQAQTNVTPNLGTTVGTPAWYTDRYAPAGFSLTNSYQGRTDVLGISVDASTNSANRAPGQQGTFYNTTGNKFDVNTAGSWSYGLDLYVDQNWANAASGYVRTDIWATATNDGAFANPSAYPIIGFTNYGGAARFRGWDDSNGWVDFGNTVNFGSWNTLMMAFDAMNNTFSYSVNGVVAGTFSALGSTGVANVMVQAYNFNDPTIPFGNVNFKSNPDFVAYWDNTPGTGQEVVPEPATMTLLATGLAGMAAARRKKKQV